MMEQPIKVTEWQQTYTYDSGIHSGVNTQVPSVSSKCLGDDDEVYGKQYTIKKTTTSYCQGGGQSQAQGRGREGDAKGVSHQLSCVSSSFFHLPHGSPVACAYRAPSGHSSTQPSTPWELLLPKISSRPSSFPCAESSRVEGAQPEPALVLSCAHTSQPAGRLAPERNI